MKNRIKRSIGILLVFAFIFMLPQPIFAASKTLVDGVWYSTEGYGSYAVVVDCQSGYSEVTVQPTFNGVPVKKIKSKAFAYLPNLTKINLPDTITEIGTQAFSE